MWQLETNSEMNSKDTQTLGSNPRDLWLLMAGAQGCSQDLSPGYALGSSAGQARSNSDTFSASGTSGAGMHEHGFFLSSSKGSPQKQFSHP